MNLFVGFLSDAYSQARATHKEVHMQMRAAIVLKYMTRQAFFPFTGRVDNKVSPSHFHDGTKRKIIDHDTAYIWMAYPSNRPSEHSGEEHVPRDDGESQKQADKMLDQIAVMSDQIAESQKRADRMSGQIADIT